MTDRIEYSSIPGFEDIYLEDSYVLSISTGHTIQINIEAVLIPSHPHYKSPGAGYCYKRMIIIFSDIKNFNWTKKIMRPIYGLPGEIDYGNIDYFFNEDVYVIGGEWGELKITSNLPTITPA